MLDWLLNNDIWALMDISSIITILSILYAASKKISTYFKGLNHKIDELSDTIGNVHNKLDETKLSLLHNDIKILIDTKANKQDVSNALDDYKKLGGNSYMEKLANDYIYDK